VVVVTGVAVRHLVLDFGLFRLLLLLCLLLLHFLHLQDGGVADLLTQALDQADGVHAVADHLQPVPGVAGDPHRAHPCMEPHVLVTTDPHAQHGRTVIRESNRSERGECIPSAWATRAMALDRLFSHGMLTWITIFCCSNNNDERKKNDQGRLETEEGTATEADAVSFNVYLHFPTDEEIKLGRREMRSVVSEEY
jgi:hypothetical protein